MPRLNIQLGSGVPADAQVYRDDVLLGRVSIDIPLPTNPGEHKITVRAPGHDDSKYSLKLAERENQPFTVNVGPVSKTPPKPAPDVAPAGAVPATAAPAAAAATAPSAGPSRPLDNGSGEASSSSTGTVQRVLGVVSGGLGLATFGAAALYWHKDSTDLKDKINGRSRAQDDLLITNVLLVSGCVLATASIVLLITAPSGGGPRGGGPSAGAPGPVQPLLSFGKDTAFIGASASF